MQKTILFLIGAALVLAAAIAYVFVSHRTVSKPQTTVAATSTPKVSSIATDSIATSTPIRAVPAGQYEYRSIEYHFSLLYPNNLTVKKFDDGGGASTITFENDTSIEGFQLYIIPYTNPQVTPAQFKKDEPSGVQQNLTNIAVDGATGAAFYSTDATLGDTREVWFIHSGYLYEVTTLKSLDPWIQSIVLTWRFI